VIVVVAAAAAAICGTTDGGTVRLTAAAAGTAVAAETGAAADAAAAAGRAQQLDAAVGDTTVVAAAAAAVVAATIVAAAAAAAAAGVDDNDACLAGTGKHSRFLSSNAAASADSINSSALSPVFFFQLAPCERSIKLFTICVFNTLLPASLIFGSACFRFLLFLNHLLQQELKLKCQKIKQKRGK